MPKMEFLNKPKSSFWEEISKDILSPFAPKKQIFLKYELEKC